MTRDEVILALTIAREGTRELDFWCWWYGASTEAVKKDPMPPDPPLRQRPDYIEERLGGWTTAGPSRSVDWALKLIPDGWVIPLNYGLSQAVHHGEWFWDCALAKLSTHGAGWVCIDWRSYRPPTPALALCIVALMARKEPG
jgi:hypothetical protein